MSIGSPNQPATKRQTMRETTKPEAVLSEASMRDSRRDWGLNRNQLPAKLDAAFVPHLTEFRL